MIKCVCGERERERERWFEFKTGRIIRIMRM